MACKDSITSLWELGLKKGFKVIRKKARVHYDQAREISNSRFDLQPNAVVFPKNAEQVNTCLQFCIKNNLGFRVCSGGHQHEGMSSLDNGIIIRLSEFNQITYPNDEKNQAWIPVGKPLKEVYDELEIYGKTIPGGGCWSVNVGGLALGGGWGTSVRKMGLTCDNFEEAEVVLASGEIVRARADNAHHELFWALRGGGGGNFGIVTKFLFNLHDLGDYISSVNFQWKNLGEKETSIVEWYLQNQKNFPADLTSVLSLRVKHKDMLKLDESLKLHSTYSALALVGKFYGRKKDLEQIFIDNGLISKFKPDNDESKWFSEKSFEKAKCSQGVFSEIIGDFVDTYTGVSDTNEFLEPIDLEKSPITPFSRVYKKKTPPNVTCLSPHPHKISSGYPKKDRYAQLAQKMVKIINDANKQNIEGVRLYMVLHGMPGEQGGIQPDASAFYYRNSDFLLQFQSWWEKPGFSGSLEKSDACEIGPKGEHIIDYDSHKFHEEWEAYKEDQESYINWITESRNILREDLEGAFINFVDKDIPLKEYYGENFEKLQRIKHKYDPKNVFNFQMSIPPKKGA